MAAQIPAGLRPHLQEYDPLTLDLQRDANLVIQRALEHGTWDDVRWLFTTYRPAHIRAFLREHGERLLSPGTFNYWRKLLRIRRWQHGRPARRRGALRGWVHPRGRVLARRRSYAATLSDLLAVDRTGQLTCGCRLAGNR